MNKRSAGAVGWQIRLSHTAQADYRNILMWTAQRFGKRQARHYAASLTSAIAALAAGPEIAGARRRDDILPDARTLHVRHDGHVSRHFLLFRIAPEKANQRIDILRILHTAMDLQRHSR